MLYAYWAGNIFIWNKWLHLCWNRFRRLNLLDWHCISHSIITFYSLLFIAALFSCNSVKIIWICSQPCNIGGVKSISFTGRKYAITTMMMHNLLVKILTSKSVYFRKYIVRCEINAFYKNIIYLRPLFHSRIPLKLLSSAKWRAFWIIFPFNNCSNCNE